MNIMINIKTFGNIARRTAIKTAAVAMTALAAMMTTACTSDIENELGKQGLDGSTRIAAPTLAAFPTAAATVEMTPGMASRAESRAVPGAGTQQKSAWEVGDSVLVKYDFLTDVSDGISSRTAIYVTYTVTDATIPTLAVNGDGKVLEYKYNTSTLKESDYSLKTLKEADLAAGVPVPEKVLNAKYRIDAHYVPGQKWVEKTDDNDKISGYAHRATDNNNIGKIGEAYFGNNFDLTEAPTIEMTPVCARLRVHALQGDAVTLSGNFYPTGGDMPADGITVEADADGNAWFYGTWLKDDNLTVQLNSKQLTDGKTVIVFQKKMESDNTAKTYAIDALAGYSEVFWDSSDKLFADAEKTTLTDAAKNATKWYVTDDGSDANFISNLLTALNLAGKEIDLHAPNAKTLVIGTAAQLLTTDGKLTEAAQSATTWILTDAGPLAAGNDVKKALDKTTNSIALVMLNVTEVNEAPPGTDVLEKCKALTTVNLPKATSIGKAAFSRCTNLKEVDLPAAATIGDYAFNYCKALTTVNLPAATKINGYPFNDCTADQITLTLNKDYSWDDFSWESPNLEYFGSRLKAIIKSE